MFFGKNKGHYLVFELGKYQLFVSHDFTLLPEREYQLWGVPYIDGDVVSNTIQLMALVFMLTLPQSVT